MSISPSTVFLNGDLDSANETLEEQLSSHFTSEESSACLFDILSSVPAGQSFHSSLLEDIDLDLQCEDDGIDSSNNASMEELERHTLPSMYSFNGAVPSISVINTDCYKKGNVTPPHEQTEDKGLGSYPVKSSSLQIKFSFPLSYSEEHKSYKFQHKQFVTCKQCSIQFSNKEALLMHNKDKHVKNEVVLNECTHCHVNFKSKKSLARHFKIHKEQRKKYESCKNSSEDVYSCESCPYIGKTRTLLSDHIRTRHSVQRKVYTCEKCQFSCLQEQTLALHHQRHEGDPKFACDQCGKLFLTMGILKRHAHTHNKTRAFLCEFQNCGKSFNIKSRLTDHMRTVHRKHTRDLGINSASKNCNSRNQFVSHSDQTDCSFFPDFKQDYNSQKSHMNMSNDTSASAVNSEDICIYDVVLPEYEINTFNSTGVNISNHINSSCSSSTALNKNKMQQKNQTFLCSDSKSENNHCSGSQNCSLQKNVKERKFVCTWDGCDKKFRDNYNLYVHKCTHTGEMQRACSLCRYRCVQKSAMDAHMKIHNKVRNTLKAPMSDKSKPIKESCNSVNEFFMKSAKIS